MRCVLANEGVVGLVDGFARATPPSPPLLAAARLAATRMRSFSSAAAARDFSNASSSVVFCAARARLGGRERLGEIGTVSLALFAPNLPRAPAEDRDAWVRGGAGASRSRLAPAIAAARAAIARVVLVATAGGTRGTARAAGFSATGLTEAPTRRGLAGDIALLSPVASSR